VVVRDVQRAQAAREQTGPERRATPSSNTSTLAPLCPLLLYTPQLWSEQPMADHYTLCLANVTAAQPTLQHIDFVDVHYSIADSRLLRPTGPLSIARLAASVPVTSVDKLELSGVVLHKGEALRLLVVYSVDGRACNDAPTALFVD